MPDSAEPVWRRASARVMGWMRTTLRTLLALLILFEEWGWVPLQRALARLGRWPPVARLERGIGRLPPWAALLVLGLPALGLLPVKLLALWFIAQGHALGGVLVIVLAKLLGTALVAHLFSLTQPALMQLPWFARLFLRWTGWKAVLLAWVRASRVWRSARALKARLRRLWRRA